MRTSPHYICDTEYFTRIKFERGKPVGLPSGPHYAIVSLEEKSYEEPPYEQGGRSCTSYYVESYYWWTTYKDAWEGALKILYADDIKRTDIIAYEVASFVVPEQHIQIKLVQE